LAFLIIALSLTLCLIWLIFITMGKWIQELYTLQNNEPPRRKRRGILLIKAL
jgi:hypothetical protein